MIGKPPLKLYDFLVLAGLLGIFIIFIYPSYGTLHLIYDSYDYMVASKSIAIYLHGKNQDGHAYLIRPPLLPAYLHIFQNKVIACWWLNLLCYITSLFLCLRLGRLLNLNGIFLYTCIGIIAISYPWIQNYFFLLTEPLFSVLILLLTCLFIEKKSLTIVVAVCIVAILLRKAGFFLVGTVACMYLVERSNTKFVILSLIFGSLFIVQELFTMHFSHFSTLEGVFRNSMELRRIHYLDVLSSWLFPRFVPIHMRWLLIMLILAIIALFYNSIIKAYLGREKIRVLSFFILGYVLCFLILFGVPDYHTGERFLSVILPLCMLFLFSFGQEVYLEKSSKRKLALLISLSLWCLYPLSRMISHVVWE